MRYGQFHMPMQERLLLAFIWTVKHSKRSLLHFSVPDTGPLSDADEYMPDFMKLLASGIKKNQDKVVKAVKTLSGSMKTNLNTPVGDMGDKVKSVVSGF